MTFEISHQRCLTPVSQTRTLWDVRTTCLPSVLVPWGREDGDSLPVQHRSAPKASSGWRIARDSPVVLTATWLHGLGACEMRLCQTSSQTSSQTCTARTGRPPAPMRRGCCVGSPDPDQRCIISIPPSRPGGDTFVGRTVTLF